MWPTVTGIVTVYIQTLPNSTLKVRAQGVPQKLVIIQQLVCIQVIISSVLLRKNILAKTGHYSRYKFIELYALVLTHLVFSLVSAFCLTLANCWYSLV